MRNEGSAKRYFNINVLSTLLKLVNVQFDISRLCARALLILFVIDSAECIGLHNESFRVHMHLCYFESKH